MEQLSFSFGNEQKKSKPVVLRDVQGRLLPGHSPGVRFREGNKYSNGRPWPAHEIRKSALEKSPFAIDALVRIIEDDKKHIVFKIQACQILLQFGFGNPDIATLVRYEIDVILARLGLPPRSQLRDQQGQRIFTAKGGFIPSSKHVVIEATALWPHRTRP